MPLNTGDDGTRYMLIILQKGVEPDIHLFWKEKQARNFVAQHEEWNLNADYFTLELPEEAFSALGYELCEDEEEYDA